MAATEAARFLGVSRQRIHALREKASFPEQHMLFGVAVFRREEMVRWKKVHRKEKR